MNKNKISIEDFPSLVSEGKLSQKDAVNKLAEEMHRNPKVFGLRNMSEEFRSELIFRFIQEGYFVFDRYKKDFCTFKSYVSSFLRYQGMTIRREYFNKEISDRTYSHVANLFAENTQETYESDEFSYKIAHYSPCSLSRTERVPYRRKRRKIKNLTVSSPVENKTGNSVLEYFNQNHSSEGKIVLIIALKTSFFLTDRQIENISTFCRISKEELEYAVESIKASVMEKYEKYEKSRTRRDDEYYMHRKYREMLENSYLCKEKEKIQHLYKFHTEKWNLRNKKLIRDTKRLCPTNKKIAELLGICERQVGIYLNNSHRLKKIFAEEK